ncbi:hypothetical protein A2U01_0097723, partial [Trifolium medium]|nr:hypothetical protein [Trifolium medium]
GIEYVSDTILRHFWSIGASQPVLAVKVDEEHDKRLDDGGGLGSCVRQL